MVRAVAESLAVLEINSISAIAIEPNGDPQMLKSARFHNTPDDQSILNLFDLFENSLASLCRRIMTLRSRASGEQKRSDIYLFVEKTGIVSSWKRISTIILATVAPGNLLN